MTDTDCVARRRGLRRLLVTATVLAVSLFNLDVHALPPLETVVREAQGRSETVLRASAEVGIAKGEQRGASVSVFGNPYLDLQVDRGSTSTKDVQALGFLYTPVDLFGQRGARVDEADALRQWREIGLSDARAIATGEAIEAYGSVQIAAERLAVALRGEQSARSEAEYFDARFQAQDATVYDQSLGQAELSRWLQTKAEAILRLNDAKTRLVRATGNIKLAQVEASETAQLPPALKHQWSDGYIAQITEKSPTLRSLEAQGAYHEKSRDRWQAERRVPFKFTLIGGRGDPGDVRLGGGIELSFPITRRNQAEIAKAQAQREQVNALEPVFRSTLEQRLMAARDSLKTVLEAVQMLDETGIPANEKAVEASSAAYKSGKVELVQMLLARRELVLARTRRLELLEAAWRSYAQLAALSGEWP